MKILYSTSAVSEGGRDGKVTVLESPLKFDMATPAELGGAKVGANPEQLFAAGYAACFSSSVQHVIRVEKLNVQIPTIHLTVGMGRNEAGGFALAVTIIAVFKGIDQMMADTLLDKAHHVCPYSNATRGNIEVTLLSKLE